MLKGKRILIFQQRGWALNIGHFLAQKLQEAGCRLGALTIKKTTHDFVTHQKDVKYEFIISGDNIKENPREFLGNDDYSLEEICSELGVDSVWPLVQASRNHVKSYKDKYYYGFKQNVSDEDIVFYVKAIYKNIKNIFSTFNPEVVISPNFVALQHIMFNLYARRRGIKMLGVTDSKISGICLFIYDYEDTNGPFLKRFKELEAGAKSENFDKAKKYIAQTAIKLSSPQNEIAPPQNKPSLRAQIRNEVLPYYKALRYWLSIKKDRLLNIPITIDSLPPRYILRDHYAHKKNLKFANTYNYYKLNKCGKYVYFPLQVQPEEVIDVMTPKFNNQIEVARQVAMSLPGDYTLVVKDHPEMAGYRPGSYLEKVARTPNIKLIDYQIPTAKVLQNAALVVSPNSTTLAEAAFLKIPAIQLGSLGTTLCLPNVYHHSNLYTLSQKIREVLKINLNTPAYDQQLINFVAGVYDAGFQFNYFSVWEHGKNENMEKLWEIYKKELEQILN